VWGVCEVGVKSEAKDFGGFAQGEGGAIDVDVGDVVGLVGVWGEKGGGAFGGG